MKTILLFCALMLVACKNDPPAQLHHDPNYTHVYVCPMDCEKGKTYEQPGECPVCHMKLKQKEVRVNQPSKDSTVHR